MATQQDRRSSLLNVDDWLDMCPDQDPDSIIYDEDYPKEVAARKAEDQKVELEKIYRSMVDVCSKIGLSGNMIDQRLNELDQCISEFINTVSVDLLSEFDKLCKYKQSLLEQVQKILSDLYLPPYEQEEDLTLLQSCKKLKNKFNELNVVKQKRMIKLQELHDKQTRHCLILGIQAPKFKTQTDIPTEDELEKLTKVVSDLEREEIRRKQKYQLLIELIAKCMHELEYEPDDDFEKNVLEQVPDYSENQLLKMIDLHAKLEAHISVNKEKYNRLKNQLVSLYERLDIPDDERQAFLATHELCKPTLMLEMELEIERYVELKKQNIGKFIEKIREELILEYERCFIPDKQQDQFFALSTVSGECNEELLELYEREVERMKKYYEDNREILAKFQEFQQLWKKLIDFELKSNDPNRFYNRGCKLLDEEKDRKRLQRALPKVENDLKTLNDAYAQRNNGTRFKVFDTNLEEFIAGCWDELNNAKEEQKKERQRAKMMGKPTQCTPAKRPPSATRNGVPPKRLLSSTKSTPKPTFRMGNGQKATSGSNGSMMSALSLSEPEFENIISNCPSSKRRH